jgi:hypothetical protein
MSKDVVLTRREYDELYDLLEKFQSIVESPVEYRKYYKDSLEKGELLENLKEDIVKYSKEEPSFKEYLMENIGESTSAQSYSLRSGEDQRGSASIRGGTIIRQRGSASSSLSKVPSLQPHSIFSPRASSRPLLRN